MKNQSNIRTILIVDDLLENLQLLTEMLTQQGYEVRAVKTGKEAIASIKSKLPDLVLLDILLPDIDGFDVCSTIKSDEQTVDVPVIFISALNKIADKIRGFSVGGVDYITKPFVTEEVLARVQTHIELSRLRIENKLHAKELQIKNTELLGEIAEREKAQSSLYVEKTRLDITLKSIGDAVISTDLQGNITFMNVVAEELTGWNFKDVQYQPLLSVFHIINQQTRELCTNPVELVLQTGSVVGLANHTVLISRKGVEYIISDSASPIKNKNGEIIGIVLIFKDDTEKHNAVEKIKSFSHIFEESLNEIYIFDSNSYKFIYANKGAIGNIGYTMKELLTLTPIDIKPDYSSEAFNALLKPLKDEETNKLIFETTHKRKNGLTYSIEVHLQKSTFDGNEVYVAIILDITVRNQGAKELVKAKEQAEESDRLKSTFLANMSHEIRTPMNGILGFSSLLKEPNLTGETQQEYIKIIEKSGSRMLNIINDIVDISRIEAGLMTLDIKESNINEQIEYIYTFFKQEVEAKGMKLSFKNTLPAKEAIIETDREKIFAILTNLVKNAIKFTREGSIEFGYNRVESEGIAALQFYVKDTGKGIPHEKKEIIFKRFMQSGQSYDINREGTGLGLSISKAYVEILGGKIWVESEERKGSTFYFTIPYNTLPKQEIASENIGTTGVEPLKLNLKILIAEDEETSERLLEIMVNMFSKQIIKARTGVETIEACRNNPDIDLILMDIQMPEMSGYEATRQIRKFNKDVVIIAQTAFGLAGDREKSIMAGCDDYISKPINKGELIKMIGKYFNR